jgi:hypothetical protein
MIQIVVVGKTIFGMWASMREALSRPKNHNTAIVRGALLKCMNLGQHTLLQFLKMCPSKSPPMPHDFIIWPII